MAGEKKIGLEQRSRGVEIGLLRRLRHLRRK
jgi:hypothetical protein